MKRSRAPRNAAGYEQDFYAWTLAQAKLLRAGELSQVDAVNVAEEIESLGLRDCRELADRLENLLSELLKWQVLAGERRGNWISRILQQRFEIGKIVEDSLSLRQFVADRLDEAYAKAREQVIDDLGLLQPDFPSECPFTPGQLLSKDFLPDP